MSLRKIVLRLDTLAAGLVTGLVLASPAFALSFTPDTLTSLPVRDWVLMGSLVLLAIAIALRLMRRGARPDMPSDTPDMRWWRNPQGE